MIESASAVMDADEIDTEREVPALADFAGIVV